MDLPCRPPAPMTVGLRVRVTWSDGSVSVHHVALDEAWDDLESAGARLLSTSLKT